MHLCTYKSENILSSCKENNSLCGKCKVILISALKYRYFWNLVSADTKYPYKMSVKLENYTMENYIPYVEVDVENTFLYI